MRQEINKYSLMGELLIVQLKILDDLHMCAYIYALSWAVVH